MLKLNSPSKINLFLKIIGKRKDGYHELASLFQALDLFDTLTFNLSDKDLFSCSDKILPLDGSNLVVKALHLFRSQTGIKEGVSIHLEKKIPHLAGLGGGSGDAATTLFGLNQLFSTELSESRLIEMASQIGSDAAFFFSSGTAYCTGRGEHVLSLAPLYLNENENPLDSWTIVKPPIGLSTPEVFRALDLSSLILKDPKASLELFKSGESDFYNDLEKAAFAVDPSMAILKEYLLASGFTAVQLCGTGSSFLCVGNGFIDLENPLTKDLTIIKVNPVNRLANKWY